MIVLHSKGTLFVASTDGTGEITGIPLATPHSSILSGSANTCWRNYIWFRSLPSWTNWFRRHRCAKCLAGKVSHSFSCCRSLLTRTYAHTTSCLEIPQTSQSRRTGCVFVCACVGFVPNPPIKPCGKEPICPPWRTPPEHDSSLDAFLVRVAKHYNLHSVS